MNVSLSLRENQQVLFFEETSPFRKCMSSESKKINLTKYPEQVHHSSITIFLNNALPVKLNIR